MWNKHNNYYKFKVSLEECANIQTSQSLIEQKAENL